MARLLLIHGRDPLVRRLAEEIIAGQQAEIAAMEASLRILRRGADPDPGGFPSTGQHPRSCTMGSPSQSKVGLTQLAEQPLAAELRLATTARKGTISSGEPSSSRCAGALR